MVSIGPDAFLQAQDGVRCLDSYIGVSGLRFLASGILLRSFLDVLEDLFGLPACLSVHESIALSAL
jgi:hypothetical protein